MAWQTKTYKRTGERDTYFPDDSPRGVPVYSGDVSKLERAVEDGWELYDAPGEEYRLRKPEDTDDNSDEQTDEAQ